MGRKNQEQIENAMVETTTEKTTTEKTTTENTKSEVSVQIARCKGTIFAAGKGSVRLSIAAGKAVEGFRMANQVVVNGKRKPLTDKQLGELLEIDDATLSRHSRIYRASLVAPNIRHLASANTAHTLAQVILHKSMIQHPDLCRMLIERNL
jgi:ribosomal protein S6E (S10)